MSINPKTNDYVPGGKWLAAPGSARESGFYALAMSMATNANEARLLDWSSDTPEKRYYNSLKESSSRHWINYSDWNENEALSDTYLADIINLRPAACSDQYKLYISVNDCAILANSVSKTAKNISLRCVNGCWEACCHFKAATNSTVSPFQTLSSERSLKLNSLISKENSTSQIAARIFDRTVNKSITPVPVDSTKNTLVGALETLSSGIKELVVAIEKRSEFETSLCTAMDKLTASLEKVTQVQVQAKGHTSFERAIHNRTPSTSSEDSSVTSSP
ncbi:hypothetical protein KCU65_g9529, partial [Aureobasidium melanogenum]